MDGRVLADTVRSNVFSLESRRRDGAVFDALGFSRVHDRREKPRAEKQGGKSSAGVLHSRKTPSVADANGKTRKRKRRRERVEEKSVWRCVDLAAISLHSTQRVITTENIAGRVSRRETLTPTAHATHSHDISPRGISGHTFLQAELLSRPLSRAYRLVRSLARLLPRYRPLGALNFN